VPAELVARDHSRMLVLLKAQVAIGLAVPDADDPVLVLPDVDEEVRGFREKALEGGDREGLVCDEDVRRDVPPSRFCGAEGGNERIEGGRGSGRERAAFKYCYLP